MYSLWTAEDEQYVVDTYASLTAREQADALGCRYARVITKRARLVRRGMVDPRTRAYLPRWQRHEIDRLRNEYSLFDLPTLARRFRRSPTAVYLKAKRLGLAKIDERYSARGLARIFGFRCSKAVARWQRKGYLRGTQVPWAYGRSHPWAFEHDDVVSFIRAYPWLLDLRRVERHYFRSVLQEEWDRDPWYGPKEAARILGVHPHSLNRYLLDGRIKGHQSGSGKWAYWKIRRSALING